MIEQYKKYNNILGWLVCIVSCTVYILTSEPTASFWDCGEFIACAFKLEVGHPPGAPLFLIFGRLFGLIFSGGNPKLFAQMINVLSSLGAGFSCMFLFWSITMLAKKIAFKVDVTLPKMIAVFGAGMVGAFAYTFTDSIWYSAVEGEVYASASFFMALVFWAMLKWEVAADEKGADRWLILIGYLIGLAVGVHLLNLLTIPAVVFIYYFKKFKPTLKGFIFTGFLSVFMLGLIQNVIVPQVVNLFALFEIFFVNSLGLPFSSGTIFFGLLILAIVVWTLFVNNSDENKNSFYIFMLIPLGLLIVAAIATGFPYGAGGIIFFSILIAGLVGLTYYGKKHNKSSYRSNISTAILSLAFLLIGYSSFVVLIIRSNADTPLNENDPSNAVNLLSYLNREQYGDFPLAYGANFIFSNDPKDHDFQPPLNPENPYKDGNPVHAKNDKTGKYEIIDDKKKSSPNYSSEYCSLFPRMWNFEKDHVEQYKVWGDIKGTPMQLGNSEETRTVYKPTFFENIKYFMNYQIGWMYVRYFMWNYVGRQNDIQGHGPHINPTDGNWYSGIKFIDNWHLGNQELLPNELKTNRGRNAFFFLPLIFGLIGLYYHYKKHRNDAFIILVLFLTTGLAIIVYLNQYPLQPRERDYAYIGSFYAFCIWIGFGVLALFEILSKKLKPTIISAIAITIASLILVPGIMGQQGWDDHDRSNRYTMVDWASDYLNSCEKNAILFTNGDNDTFPLWYAQEVEGIRTDVRVCNLSLLNTGWYIDQMKKRAYDSDPVPFTLKEEQYRESEKEYTYIKEEVKDYTDLKEVVGFICSDNPSTKIALQDGRKIDYCPTRKFKIDVDKNSVLQNNVVPKSRINDIISNISWEFRGGGGIQKSQLMVLDLIAHNNWKRPIYFAITTGPEAYMGLEPFFQLEGLAYKFVPLKDTTSERGEPGTVNTEKMYDNIMNKFKWGNMNNPNVYLDETNKRMVVNFRNNFSRLAEALLKEGKNDLALKVLKRCEEIMPENIFPYDYFMTPIAEMYYRTGDVQHANSILKKVSKYYSDDLKYYFSLSFNESKRLDNEKQRALQVLNRLAQITKMYKQDAVSSEIETVFTKYYSQYSGGGQ